MDQATMDNFEEFKLAPDRSQRLAEQLDQFLSVHIARVGQKSGGTTVPLEKNTVRFIDNFSVGTRGAASAEYVRPNAVLIMLGNVLHVHSKYFLHAGYAVIHLHRRGSLLPFDRHFRKADNVLSLFKLSQGDQSVEVDQSKLPNALQLMKEFDKVQREQRLLSIDFTTLQDYLSLLRFICQRLKPMGRRAVICLAAAVSDYFIPPDELPVHKIQSANGPLNLELKLTPKVLRAFVIEAAPEAYVASFKLETDPMLLEKKARDALKKYNHQLVIGNMLATRKVEVVFVTVDSIEQIRLTESERERNDVEIEQKIVDRLVQLHNVHCAN